MKNGKAIFLSAAVILGAAGMIFGNYVLASGAFAAGNAPEAAIVMPESVPASKMQFSDVEMHSNSDGVVYLASAKHSEDAEKQEELQTLGKPNMSDADQNPINGNLGEEEAKQIGIKAIADKFELTQNEIELFDVTIRARYSAPLPANIANMKPTMTAAEEAPSTEADMQPTAEADVLIWNVILTPINQKDYPTIERYTALFDDNSLGLMNIHAVPLIRPGTPIENEISFDKAQELAINAIVQKYALTQKTLDKFNVTVTYFEIYPDEPDKHIWRVCIDPVNTDDFSEIGCYMVLLDAETGNTLKLTSAANGIG